MSSSSTSSSSSETVAAACSSRRSSNRRRECSSLPSFGRLQCRRERRHCRAAVEIVERQVFLVAAELEQPFHYIVAILVFDTHFLTYREVDFGLMCFRDQISAFCALESSMLLVRQCGDSFRSSSSLRPVLISLFDLVVSFITLKLKTHSAGARLIDRVQLARVPFARVSDHDGHDDARDVLAFGLRQILSKSTRSPFFA